MLCCHLIRDRRIKEGNEGGRKGGREGNKKKNGWRERERGKYEVVIEVAKEKIIVEWKEKRGNEERIGGEREGELDGWQDEERGRERALGGEG